MASRIDPDPYVGRLEPSGLAWAWWQGDSLPDLEPLAGLRAGIATADKTLADLNQISVAEVFKRVRAGHRPYVAMLDDEPVAYGWVATREASFGGGRVRFEVPLPHRYLWDFATRPAWRGRGVYPRLLQAILAAERAEADRFWILHEWFNRASRHGIARAGFQSVATLYFLGRGLDDGLGVAPYESSPRAPECAAFLGLPLLSSDDT